MRTARSKGAPERRILLQHVLRNSLLPVVTILGMDIGLVLGGAIFTESIFNLHGLGQQLVTSANQLDLPVIMGIVIFSTIAVVVCNLIVDIAYAFLDPRIRLSSLRSPRSGEDKSPFPSQRERMGALLKKAGLAAIVLDLLVGGTAFAALHHRSGSAAPSGKMSAAALEQLVGGPGAARPTCTADPNGGFDYLCQAGGARTLYDVTADHITNRVELP